MNRDLENFLKDNSLDGGFLQSDPWMNFQKENGSEVFSLFIEDTFRISMVFHKLPFVKGYFFIPRGPILSKKDSGSKAARQFIDILKLVSRKGNVAWIRIEPQDEKILERIKRVVLKNKYKFVKSKKDHQPVETLMLNLEKSKEEILKDMKPKTRYNIRLAQRKGVEIIQSKSKDNIQEFLYLSRETAKRDNISIHSSDYYLKMFKVIPRKNIKLYLAKYRGKVIATALISFYGEVATYLHGASSDDYRNVMASYLLQWQAICDSKDYGCKKYDFGGVGIIGKNKKDSWKGITKFKKGFCPKCDPVIFPGCWDIVLSWRRYYCYRILQLINDFSANLRKRFRKLRMFFF